MCWWFRGVWCLVFSKWWLTERDRQVFLRVFIQSLIKGSWWCILNLIIIWYIKWLRAVCICTTPWVERVLCTRTKNKHQGQPQQQPWYWEDHTIYSLLVQNCLQMHYNLCAKGTVQINQDQTNTKVISTPYMQPPRLSGPHVSMSVCSLQAQCFFNCFGTFPLPH